MLTLFVIHVMKLKAYLLITVLRVISDWKSSLKCKDTMLVRDCNHLPRGNMNSEWAPVFSELASSITDVKAPCHSSGTYCQHLLYYACEWTHGAACAKRKKKSLCSLFQVFIETFLSNYNLFDMGRIFSIKECSLRAVTLESALVWCAAEASQGTTTIFRYTFN